MKKYFVILLVLTLAFSAFASGTKGDAAAEGAEFIIWNGGEPEAVDPHLISGVTEHRISYSLFEGLTTDDPKDASPIPGLAESWEVSGGGTIYTFKLRKTTWSDGVPITAQQVKDSWLRMLSPEMATPYAWFPAMFIKGAEDYNAGMAGPETVAIKAIDDYTFQLETVGPMPYVLGALTHYAFAVVPLHAIEKYGKEWTSPENFVGNGPFVLDEWKPQERLSCVPNPKYWDKDKVKLGRVTYIPNEDNNTGYNMFLNGECDWGHEVPKDQIDSAKLRDDFQTAPYLGTYYYIFQNEKPPFDDARVRKALSLVVDRKTLVEKVTRSGEVSAYKMVPDGMAGYPGIKGLGEDVAQAKKLLAAAGYPDGKGFPSFEILHNTSESHKKIAEYIQQEWKEKLGVDCTIINQEWKTYLSTRRAGEFQVSRAGWIGDYQDPNTFLDMFVSGTAMNGGRYSNTKFDEIIAKAARMPAGKERMDTLMEAERYFIEQDHAIMPIYHYTSKNMIDLSKWGGWYKNLMDYHPTKFIFKK